MLIASPSATPTRPAYDAGRFDIAFASDAPICPENSPVGVFATQTEARTAATAFAQAVDGTALLYEREGGWQVWEALTKPGGIAYAAVAPGRFQLHGKIADTEPRALVFHDPTLRALISAERVMENVSGHDRVRF